MNYRVLGFGFRKVINIFTHIVILAVKSRYLYSKILLNWRTNVSKNQAVCILTVLRVWGQFFFHQKLSYLMYLYQINQSFVSFRRFGVVFFSVYSQSLRCSHLFHNCEVRISATKGTLYHYTHRLGRISRYR